MMTLEEFEKAHNADRELAYNRCDGGNDYDYDYDCMMDKLIKLARAAKKVKDNELIIIRTLDYATTEKYIEAAKIVGEYKDSVEEVFGDES